MKKAIALTLGLALSTPLAHAQPAPTPAPAQPDDAEHPVKPVPDKAGTNETLNQGQNDARPWASGVSSSEQQVALGIFRDGNAQLNDGFFVKAAEKYREALKHWDHPAISYNLALALMNLDQPIEVYESLQKSVRFGVGPLEKDKFEHANEYMVLVSQQLADIQVSCDKPGAKVSVDGKVVFQAPGTYKSRVRIGKHTFFAEKQGYTAHIGAPFIGPGEKFRIELKLYTAEELTRYHRKWEATWMPWTVAAAGVVVAGAWYFSNACASSPASSHAAPASTRPSARLPSTPCSGAKTGSAIICASSSRAQSRQRKLAASPTAASPEPATLASSAMRTNSPGARNCRLAAMPCRSASVFCNQRRSAGCGIRIVSGTSKARPGTGLATWSARMPASSSRSLPWYRRKSVVTATMPHPLQSRRDGARPVTVVPPSSCLVVPARGR